MKSMKFLLIIFGVLFALALITSCSEQEVEFSSTETSTYESEENLEAAFELISSITNSGMESVEANGMGRMAQQADELSCAMLTYSGTKESGRLEIDYGDGCVGPDGRTYKGIIVLEYSGRRYIPGSVVYTVFEDFYIDGYKIEGTRKSTNITTEISHPKFEIEVTNGKITWPDESGFATWNADRVHTWSISEDQSELVLSIEGTASGVNKSGNEYFSEIVQPLVLKSGCISVSSFIPVQGLKTISVGDDLDINVNYGDGSCDRSVTISVGRQSKDIVF